jgi:hypothetical protein
MVRDMPQAARAFFDSSRGEEGERSLRPLDRDLLAVDGRAHPLGQRHWLLADPGHHINPFAAVRSSTQNT